jgi:hypothetical protein
MGGKSGGGGSEGWMVVLRELLELSGMKICFLEGFPLRFKNSYPLSNNLLAQLRTIHTLFGFGTRGFSSKWQD